MDYTITQKFDREGISEKKVYTNAYTNEDIINLNVKKDANGNIITPNVTTVHRVQLAYSEVDEDGTFKITDASGNVATVTKNDDGTANVSVVDSQGNAIASLDDGSGNPVNITFTSDDNYVPGDDEITINTQLGEVLLGENVYNNTYTNNSFSVQYDLSLIHI